MAHFLLTSASYASFVDSGSGWFYFLLYSDQDCSAKSVSLWVTSSILLVSFDLTLKLSDLFTGVW